MRPTKLKSCYLSLCAFSCNAVKRARYVLEMVKRNNERGAKERPRRTGYAILVRACTKIGGSGATPITITKILFRLLECKHDAAGGSGASLSVGAASPVEKRAQDKLLTRGAKVCVTCFFFLSFLFHSSETRNNGIECLGII